MRLRLPQMGGTLPLVRPLEHDEGIYRIGRGQTLRFFPCRRCFGRYRQSAGRSALGGHRCRRRTAHAHARCRTEPSARRGACAGFAHAHWWRTGHRKVYPPASNCARTRLPRPLCEWRGERKANQAPRGSYRHTQRRPDATLRDKAGRNICANPRSAARHGCSRFGPNDLLRGIGKLAWFGDANP